MVKWQVIRIMSNAESIIPARYFSWEEIGKAERINIDILRQHRNTTYSILVSKCNALGFPSFKAFARHYNNYSNQMITDKRYNAFFYHTKLQPIAHLFHLLAKDKVSREGKVREVAEFGVLKSHYEHYRKHGQPPDVFNRGATKQHFTTENQNKRTKVDIPITPEWQRFRAGIKYANKISGDPITTPNAILIAIDEYMQKRPDIFGEDKRTLPDDSQIRTKTNSRIHADIDPELVAKASQIIARYNAVNTSKIDWSGFVEMAVKGLVERLPVVYSDPELAAELEEQK